MAAARAAGEAALALMEEKLAQHAWFAGESVSLADVALYAYTHVSEAGGFRLADYPAVQAWIPRIQALPGFVAMD